MVALASKCAGFSESTIHHEVLHALGFEHEHARQDRDKFLNVNLEVGQLSSSKLLIHLGGRRHGSV